MHLFRAIAFLPGQQFVPMYLLVSKRYGLPLSCSPGPVDCDWWLCLDLGNFRPVVHLSGNKDLAFLENKWLVWKFTLPLEYNTISAHMTAAHTPCDHRLESNASQGSAANPLYLYDTGLFGLELQVRSVLLSLEALASWWSYFCNWLVPNWPPLAAT